MDPALISSRQLKGQYSRPLAFSCVREADPSTRLDPQLGVSLFHPITPLEFTSTNQPLYHFLYSSSATWQPFGSLSFVSIPLGTRVPSCLVFFSLSLAPLLSLFSFFFPFPNAVHPTKLPPHPLALVLNLARFRLGRTLFHSCFRSHPAALLLISALARLSLSFATRPSPPTTSAPLSFLSRRSVPPLARLALVALVVFSFLVVSFPSQLWLLHSLVTCPLSPLDTTRPWCPSSPSPSSSICKATYRAKAGLMRVHMCR